SGTSELLDELRRTLEKVVSIVGALSVFSGPSHRDRIIDRYTGLLAENAGSGVRQQFQLALMALFERQIGNHRSAELA
ncbi:hypothetical protein AB9F45_39910, partial [Rhizobium leguminosarum]